MEANCAKAYDVRKKQSMCLASTVCVHWRSDTLGHVIMEAKEQPVIVWPLRLRPEIRP